MAKSSSRGKRGRNLGGAGGGGPSILIGTTDVTLTGQIINESQPDGTVLATADANPNIAILTLVDNAGGRFAFDGTNLSVGATPLNSDDSPQKITIRAVRGIFTNDTDFEITISESAPTSITPGTATFSHTLPSGSILSEITSNYDHGDTTYTLADNSGGRLSITAGNKLTLAETVPAGTYNYSITATNNAGSFTHAFTLTAT